jgi:uncharacterized membrane protein
MKIYISDLKKISNLLINHLNDLEIKSIEISKDFYWVIDKTKVYDPYKEPTLEGCSLGQLTDDWEKLQKILNKENEPISYALVWLASILRIIGEEIP